MKLKVFAMCFPCSLLHNFPAASMASLAPLAPPLLAPLGPLYVETTHPDTNTAKASLQEHAKASGFAISVDSSSARRVFYICSKGGKYSNQGKDPTVHESRQRKNTGTIKTECPYRAVARKLEDGGYKLEVLEHNHNHGAVMALSALPQHRVGAMTLEERSKIKQMNSENHSANQILTSL
jgi:hypothetical protein